MRVGVAGLEDCRKLSLDWGEAARLSAVLASIRISAHMAVFIENADFCTPQ